MDAIEKILGKTIWEPTASADLLFSSDHVIEAYLKGKEDGLGQAQKLIYERLSKNVVKAGENTYKIVALLKAKKLNPEDAFLKINSWDEFEILITLPEVEFLSKEFLETYSAVSILENSFNEDLYDIQFNFTDIITPENDTHLESDGYLFKLNLKAL